MKNLTKLILIGTLVLNLIGCVGDDVQQNNQELQKLQDKLTQLNENVGKITFIGNNIAYLTKEIHELVEILKKLSPKEQEKLLSNLSPELITLIEEDIKNEI